MMKRDGSHVLMGTPRPLAEDFIPSGHSAPPRDAAAVDEDGFWTCTKCKGGVRLDPDLERPEHGMCWPCASEALDEHLHARRVEDPCLKCSGAGQRVYGRWTTTGAARTSSAWNLPNALAGSRDVSRNIIYGLVDPRTLLVRYVGKSTSGVRRPREHRRDPRRWHTHISRALRGRAKSAEHRKKLSEHARTRARGDHGRYI